MQYKEEWYRIAKLEKLSGFPRRTIHFYVKEGLLHQPKKTGKTMAYYDITHLHKLSFIKNAKLKGLPLIAIKEKMAELRSMDENVFEQQASAIFQEKRPSRLHKKGQKTREVILSAGSNLFREKGYKGTKITDITKTLNIGKGTFYFYFSDKKELFLECVPRIFHQLFSEGWGRIRKVKNPLRRLELRSEAVLPVLKEFCAIIQLCKEAMEDADPKLQALGKQTYLSICVPIESDIKKGIERGLFAPVNPKMAAAFMVGIMENLYYLKMIDSSLQPSIIWGNIRSLIVNGISGPGH